MNQSNRWGASLKPAASISPSDAQVLKGRELGVNTSLAGEDRPELEVRHETAKRWQDANVAGFEAWGAYINCNGVPLAKYRKF
jgi:post-segregation antitoxin (ccd killing protein)